MAADELALRYEEQHPVDAAPRERADWWAEAKGIFWLVLAVLGFHSLVAKPFYIPSESMLPGLLHGDRLVVTKFPYGYSFVTPTFHFLPFVPRPAVRPHARARRRGDRHPAGDQHRLHQARDRAAGRSRRGARRAALSQRPAVPRTYMGERMLPVDPNTRCEASHYPGMLVTGADHKPYCRLPIYRETLPGGRSYDTVDMGDLPGQADHFAEMRVPRDHVFLMGDNRDNSADSRFATAEGGLGGPVPWENLGGRAEFITFSLDGSATWNPATWIHSFRPGRAGLSLHPSRDAQ